MTWWGAVLAYVIGPAIAVGGSVLVARRTGKTADKAAEATADTAREANAIDGFDRLVKGLEKRVEDLERRDTENSARIGELDREVGRLRDERRRHRSLIRRLWDQLQAALLEIKRLGGTPPPDVYRDAEAVRLILDSDSP